MDFYQSMTLIAVLALVVLVIFAVRTLMQIKRTAESVEYLTMLTAENVEKTQSTFDLLHHISSMLDGTFYKAARLAVDLVQCYRHPKEK